MLDQETKLIPTFAVGKRSADNARRLMMDLRTRLAMPNAHASDAHGYQPGRYQPVTKISTDGFAAYPEAVDLAFGPYVEYGQIIKEYRNARMDYTPSEMVGTQRRNVRGITEGELWTICTSHVERNNLTLRTFIKRFARLTLGSRRNSTTWPPPSACTSRTTTTSGGPATTRTAGRVAGCGLRLP